MPANLTQQYHKAEEAYRRAASPDEELQCLQTMLRELPKHKGTDKLQAELKQKISKAKKQVEQAPKQGKGGGGGLKIPRQGAGRVVLLGGPNAGKSQFVASVTRATPEVAPYPFTTREPGPAMMPHEDIAIQLVDTPPITSDYFEPVVQALIRGADLALLFIDLSSDEGIDDTQALLSKLETTKTRLATESYLDENDIGLAFTKTFAVANKLDVEGAGDRLQLLHEFLPLDFREFVISSTTMAGVEELKAEIFRALDVVRVYTKLPTKKEPDYDKPFTIRRGGTLLDIAELIHKDVARDLKTARVWGSEVHDGTTVKTDYILHDKDVVELHV